MEETLVRLAKEVDQRYYGKYRGFVEDNIDPEKLGRLKLSVPSVLNDQISDWALPCLPFGGNGYGFFAIPEKSAQVWVEFEEGDISRPIWTGVLWELPDHVPTEGSRKPPSTRLWRTPSGHILQFDDEKNKERIRIHHRANAEILIDEQGRIELSDAAGGTVRIDAQAREIVVEDHQGNMVTLDRNGTKIDDVNGNSMEMSASGVKIDSGKIVLRAASVNLGGEGGEPVVKGQSFVSMFMSHIHTVAPIVGGPTSPPIPQGELSTLSTTVTTI